MARPNPARVITWAHLAQRRSQALRYAVPVIAVAVALTAVGMLLAWGMGDAALQAQWPRLFLMKPTTAAGLLLLATALLGLWRGSAPWLTFSSVCSVTSVLLALATLAEYTLQVDLGIDRLFALDSPTHTLPGRMSVGSAVNLLLLAMGMWLNMPSRAPRLSQPIFFVSSALPIMALGGYLYNAPDLAVPTPAPVVALHTALCMFLLSAGGLFVRSTAGLMRLLLSEYVAGTAARRLIPAAVILPTGIGALVLHFERAGLFSPALGTAVLVAACALLFAGAVWVTTWLMARSEEIRVIAERQRAVAEQNLIEGEQRLRIAIDTARLGTWEHDPASGAFLCSAQYKANYGLAPDAFFDQGTLMESIVEEHRERVCAAVRTAQNGGPDYREEYAVRWPDGSRHWVVASGRALIENGKTVRMVGVNLDITARRTAEEDLKLADRRKDEFLATLAHELRNPLAPIRQAAKIARAPESTAAKRAWGLDVIDRQATHMAVLLDDLLDVSRITRGVLHLHLDWIDVATLMETALETVRPKIEEKRQRVRAIALERAVRIRVDAVRIAQVLSNLLINAAKYSNPGDEIVLRAEADETVRFRVIDRGIGLAPEMLTQIFIMFSQVERALERSDGGLGIGLALVKGVTELHGGTVHASSPGLGLGSEFVVSLPREAEPVAAVAQPAPATPPAAPALRILVADDNRDAAESLQMLLEMEGHEVRVTYDGQMAIEMAHRYRPDVMLLDVGMPTFNGYEVAMQVRRSDWAAATKIVAVTGWGQPDDLERARAAGFDHHLTKPLQYDTLLTLLNSAARGAFL